jgi:hypothetical protein
LLRWRYWYGETGMSRARKTIPPKTSGRIAAVGWGVEMGWAAGVVTDSWPAGRTGVVLGAASVAVDMAPSRSTAASVSEVAKRRIVGRRRDIELFVAAIALPPRLIAGSPSSDSMANNNEGIGREEAVDRSDC